MEMCGLDMAIRTTENELWARGVRIRFPEAAADDYTSTRRWLE